MHDLNAVDVLRERLDATYTEAMAALDATEGDLVAALAYIEQQRLAASSDIASFVKDLVDEVRTVVAGREVRSARIMLRGQTVATLPLALVGVAAGLAIVLSALVSQCRVEVTTTEAEPAVGEGEEPPA